MTPEHQRFHLDHRLLGVAPRTVGILLWWKVGFEDRFQYQQRCRHADPIPQGRDAQRPELAVGLRYEHASDRLRSVCLPPERKRWVRLAPNWKAPPCHGARGKPTFAAATVNGQLAPSPGGGDSKIDLKENF